MGKYDDRLPLPLPGPLSRDLLLSKPPFWMLAIILIAIAIALTLLAGFALKRSMMRSSEPIHFIQDMDNQPKYKAQSASPVFADGRADRLPPPNTLARGKSDLDTHYTYGVVYEENDAGQTVARFATSLPAQIQIDRRFMERGREMYDVYCATCHGLDGRGNGPTWTRAIELNQTQFIQPSNLLALGPDKTLSYWSNDNTNDADRKSVV